VLFDRVDDARPSRVIALDPRIHRTYHYWHAFVPGTTHGQLYAFRVHGSYDPTNGLRFDATKILLDPYGKCVARPNKYRRAGSLPARRQRRRRIQECRDRPWLL
jgi:glycogen operon protein